MARKPFNPDLVKPPDDGGLFQGADRPISVSELTAMVKRALSRLPASLAVAGEISNFSRSPNGHLYFTLKDESASVNCVMWKSAAVRLKFQPESGLAVVAFGQIDVYEPRGQYQLYVNRLLPAGRGELELAFRQLCDRLEKLGWFDASRKRPIPRIPQTIGVVTSRTGAAIRDILRTLAIRWPAARVVVADARVQGEGSAESVARAIGQLNRHAAALGGVDVLIVARGGGSLEDLWAFNTEPVARAIRDSRIPVVTGIGHEIDTTIADLVADVRAATPTAAAQAVVPDRREVAARLAMSAAVLRRLIRQRLADLAGRLADCARLELFRRPATMLRGPRQRLDELAGELAGLERDTLHRRVRRLSELIDRLRSLHPRAIVARWGRRIEVLAGALRWGQGQLNRRAERDLLELTYRLRSASPAVGQAERVGTIERLAGSLRASAGRHLVRQAQRLDAFAARLAAVDPRAVLRRGYSMTTLKRTGALLTRAEQAQPGDRLVTELAAGRVESEVVGASDASSPPPPSKTSTSRPPVRRDGPADQLKLDFSDSPS